ncbi:hypothetical protein [Hufsiella ginkgonis]|uniref:Uncharacterized protein n=1 Tax=Hufsiella ginkgonis TaxID=2695274 RepID=A0A7K1XTL6_9SPHI|nr:hypothetical protein [Hufsiella ginkgonis]MXV14312.1 hypothetical protein [Hufsiella ginkgonis]
MTKVISIPESHLKYLVPAYQAREAELVASILELQDELQVIRKVLSRVEVENSQTHVPTTFEGQNIKEPSLYTKVRNVLLEVNRPMSLKEIHQALTSNEPEKIISKNTLSAVLTMRVQRNKLIKGSNGSFNTYMLPDDQKNKAET